MRRHAGGTLRDLTTLVALGCLSGCTHRDRSPTEFEPTGPAALPFVITVPNEDAAVSLTVAGGQVDSVTAPGLRALILRSDSSSTAVLLRGPLHREASLFVHVPEQSLAPRYAMTVDDAVARGTYERRSLDGYRAVRVETSRPGTLR